MAVGLAACAPPPAPITLTGRAQGSTYMVKLRELPPGIGREELRARVEATLAAIDERMSSFRPDSELARFNRDSGTDWVPASPELVAVLGLGQEVARRSGGAFDVTVAPLVELWGFGAGGQRPPPTAAELAAAAGRVGFQKLALREQPPALRRLVPGVTITVAGIAQGWTVDALGQALDALGATDWVVEVGGEVRGRGRRPDGRPWQIGIEAPLSGQRALQRVVALDGLALSTSGDYRNYREVDGRRLSHTIDPRSGRPIEHGLASVSVVGPDCGQADAWATALMVLGPQAGLALAEREGLAAYLIVRSAEGFSERTSSAWQRQVPAGRP